MVLPKNLVKHHCDYIVVHGGKSISTPAIINTSTFGIYTHWYYAKHHDK